MMETCSRRRLEAFNHGISILRAVNCETYTISLPSTRLTEGYATLSSLIQRLPLPYAVFDLHFHPRDPSILAIATSAASVALFKVSSGLEPTISHLWTLPVHEDPSTPALFLAWAPRNWFSRPEQDGFAVTFSDGRTSVYGTASADKTEAALTEQSNVTQLGTFEASQPIEVWFVALASLVDLSSGPEEPGIPHLFTGDDFGSLHSRQFRAQAAVQSEEEEPLPPLVLDYDDRARHHTAGVTSILPLPLPLRDGAPLLLTGSYDEYVRVYHATRRGQVLAEECLGGGVWRLQLLKTEQMPAEEGEGEGWRFLILASCMHAGTRVVAVTGTPQGADDDSGLEWGIDVLAKFTEHESMNYASDVWKAEGGYDLEGKDISELVCVSSSFYDRRVCVWRVDLQRDRPPISDREVK
jgi:diphthamide biosynthesis protein 7